MWSIVLYRYPSAKHPQVLMAYDNQIPDETYKPLASVPMKVEQRLKVLVGAISNVFSSQNYMAELFQLKGAAELSSLDFSGGANKVYNVLYKTLKLFEGLAWAIDTADSSNRLHYQMCWDLPETGINNLLNIIHIVWQYHKVPSIGCRVS